MYMAVIFHEISYLENVKFTWHSGCMSYHVMNRLVSELENSLGGCMAFLLPCQPGKSHQEFLTMRCQVAMEIRSALIAFVICGKLFEKLVSILSLNGSCGGFLGNAVERHLKPVSSTMLYVNIGNVLLQNHL